MDDYLKDSEDKGHAGETPKTLEVAEWTHEFASPPRPNFYSETVRHEPPKARGSFKRKVALVALASVLGGCSLGVGIGLVGTAADIILPGLRAQRLQEFQQPEQQDDTKTEDVFAFNNQTAGVSVPNVSPLGSYREIVNKVEPSVVNILSMRESSQSFFNVPETPKGSGIIFSEDAEKVYIVTNNHVISEAAQVSVSVSGSEGVQAKLVGKQPQSDLAVIYVLKSDLKAVGVEKVAIATFGNSDDMYVGDVVLAIGNAMGEGNTATQGIVSAKNKTIVVDGITLTVIQTDAAVNPGNSGGPLVNLNGDVVGINTAKLMQQSSTGAEGMGYSITSNEAKPIIEELMTSEPKAFLGIAGRKVDAEMAEMFNIPEIGVLVEEVIVGTAAEEAGLKVTDIITSFNGEATFTMEDLQAAIKKCKIGDTVEVKLLRGGKEQLTVKATLRGTDENGF